MVGIQLYISPRRLPYYRMTGYIITILMHVTNTYVMLRSFRDDVLRDPDIQLFASFMFKFITCWTFFSQTVHAALGLSCDLLALTIGDQYMFLKHMRWSRDVLFASIVVPFTMCIPTIFWPLFLYNRELVLPFYTTKIVGTISNHVMHTAVMPVTLWELAFQPRQAPTSHKLNFSLMTTFSATYLIVIFITYFERGVFPYPIMNMLFGSVYFVVLMTFILVWLPVYYYGQWHITSFFWRENKKIQ